MKKLFKAIRQRNIEEVQKIVEKYPEAVNTPATSPPKKDNGQSPLQVALKLGEIEIANYLIEAGADIHFMEVEDDDTGLRCPILQDAIHTALECLPYGTDRIVLSEKSVDLIAFLLKHGVDPNIFNSSGFDAWAYTIQVCESLVECNHGAIEHLIIVQTYKILDLLLQYGADKDGWLDRNYLVRLEETNRQCYVDTFVPKSDKVQTYVYHGKKYDTIIKGDIDRHAKMRAILQKYYMQETIL